MRLGVNIDHIAYLRETRKINDPDPLEAIFIAKRAGADQITLHLREDRRHIHDSDLYRIAESSFLPLNVECCSELEMIHLISKVKPHRVTLVPEKRDEVTTEGGLKLSSTLLESLKILRDNEIEIALFIDPNIESVEKSADFSESLKAPIAVELHTGKYANLSLMLNSNLSRMHNSIQTLECNRERLKAMLAQEVQNLQEITHQACKANLNVYAGHGLNYANVRDIVNIQGIEELNIGQSIIARSIFVGLEQAIKDMKALID
ncbi:pyridoxine 5'-phosphate synthase [Helicobacter trogontum]|uniref:Pyridoxine 5'-phosphate synthase n=1 Tax=Helicobacter trogontum TaxID=50960 RepID=A0A4U8SC67_9HELI|nr:pyridoxine 5'-phosphate synthase [Helicobacter trogontum]TLD83728.1 pyridoxine 5'-phosphate synthase [Helicobacter trogontum]